MKVINKITTVIFVLFGALGAFAQPPSPDGPEPPPSPIDGVGLLMLAFAAISLGIYVIYKHKLKTKASV
ncbi:hypothetical protein [Flavobacterium hibisci]|uniref:hypothetical protein n=1 Tax=Flavobacterium hibisci TaxID=1914462 RepID=UPI001CC0E4EB|nr:hypothetical protein [Flavobacterium hibisci]MBZ4043492.1 hypothetical protein [Flavobacterium hibisci]